MPPGSNAGASAGLNAQGLFGLGLSTSRSGMWTPPSIEELQRALPQYEILSLAGRGGMGAVYKAWQRSLDRHVAIKVLPASIEQDEAGFAERFKREAKAMARLTHPNIVGVHDAGETGGLLYFVMDFVEGTDLHQRIVERGLLPPSEALAIAARVCDALGYAHSKGVVHRDIKPSNVMIDSEGNVKVADFGLARLTSAESNLTVTHLVMGTPDYMAPEQRKGMQVDQRADIYSLGVMLYQMLCGELPHGVFSPPSTKVPCDPRVDAIVTKALQSDPERRYQSTADLRTEVEGLRAGAESGPAEAARASGRHKLVLEAVIVLLVAGGVWWFTTAKTNSSSTTPPSPAGALSSPAPAAVPAPLEADGGRHPEFFPLPMTQRPTQVGQVVMWRHDGKPVDPNDVEARIPAGLDDVVMIAADSAKPGHVIALKADGTVAAWGNNADGRAAVPAGLRDIVSIVACGGFSAVLNSGGRVLSWGNGYSNFPHIAERVVQLSGQKFIFAALTESGHIFLNNFVIGRDGKILPKFVVPPELDGRAVSVAVAGDWLCALRDDGALFAWGSAPATLEKPFSPTRVRLPWNPSGNRIPIQPGKVPALFTDNYTTDVIVTGHERFPIRLEPDLPGYIRDNSKFLFAHRLDLTGLEAISNVGPAIAAKIAGHWRFDRLPPDGSISYAEFQAEGCTQLAMTASHTFGLRPNPPRSGASAAPADQNGGTAAAAGAAQANPTPATSPRPAP